MIPNFLTDDHLDLIELLHHHDVDFLLVGGVAVNYYGYNRSTGDIDIFYRRTPENTEHLFNALRDFFNGTVPGLGSPSDLMTRGLVLQFGVPPHRIDFVNDIDGVEFASAWANRRLETVDDADIRIPLIGLSDLVTNKRASDRPKDLDDFQYLSQLEDED
jgi:hypothetical protein